MQKFLITTSNTSIAQGETAERTENVQHEGEEQNKIEKEKEMSVGVETLLHRPAAAAGANDGDEAAAAACTGGTVLMHNNANTARHARRVICSLRFIVLQSHGSTAQLVSASASNSGSF